MKLACQCIAVVLFCAVGGCGLMENPITCNPGPTSYQVAQARKFDPYPDPTTGPAIMGGRPLGFMEPRPEPDVTKNARFFAGAGTSAPVYVPTAAATAPAGSYVVTTPQAPAGSYAVSAAQPAANNLVPVATAPRVGTVPAVSATTPANLMPVAAVPATTPAVVPAVNYAAPAQGAVVPAMAYGKKIDGP